MTEGIEANYRDEESRRYCCKKPLIVSYNYYYRYSHRDTILFEDLNNNLNVTPTRTAR